MSPILWLVVGILVGAWVWVCRREHKQLQRRISQLNSRQSKRDSKEMMGLLCGGEFRCEFFVGINLAFYRTFASPTISGTYHRTGTIEGHTLKRIEDTDLLMHSWMDFGVEAEEATRSFAQTARIHGLFNIRNDDFLFVLCCFVVDIHKMNQLLGCRSFTKREKEANFLFWMEVGQRMNIQDLPQTLEEAERLVQDYVLDDRRSKATKGGKVLTEAVTKLLVQQARAVLPLLPELWVRSIVSVLLYEVGGRVFHRKLGFSSPPNKLERFLLLSLCRARGWFFWNFVRPPKSRHRLSEELMKRNYGRSIHEPTAFLDVGPESLIK